MVFEHIQQQLSTLPDAEQRVGRWVLKHPQDALHLPVKKIALQAKCSEPTVIRFCRSLGFDGLTEFKFALASSNAPKKATSQGVPFLHAAIAATDNVQEWTHKVINNTLLSIQQFNQSISESALAKAIDMLLNASHLECWGLGQSGIVAMDAQHKLFRAGVVCLAYQDSHIQTMSAALLNKNTVLIAISDSGKSKELLSALKLAKKNGALIIAITRSISPLARLAHIVLSANTQEDTSIFTPMNTRIIHLLWIDLLALGVMQAKQDNLLPKLKKMKQALQLKKR